MKDEYTISIIEKSEASSILLKYHYLKDISKGFKSGINVGLFKKNVLVGVCIFTGFPVPELTKGMFGLERNDQEGFYELSRLCLLPDIQKMEHNITSWFVSRSIKFLKKNYKARALLSYADSDFHGGTIYKACNFKYYGLSEPKCDFYIEKPDGTFIKHSRGKIKGIKGVWKPRSRKHRFVIVFDKKLKILWNEVN
jgi:hypothetical protein